MRDPRSIAWSLTTMSWGPDELETAASWVASYCRQWLKAEADAADFGVPLMRVHVEDVVAEPNSACAALGGWLRLDPTHLDLASGLPEMLTRWVRRATPDQRAMLDQRLAGWVRHFGYDQARIGHRSPPAASASEAAA